MAKCKKRWSGDGGGETSRGKTDRGVMLERSGGKKREKRRGRRQRFTAPGRGIQ